MGVVLNDLRTNINHNNWWVIQSVQETIIISQLAHDFSAVCSNNSIDHQLILTCHVCCQKEILGAIVGLKIHCN